MQFNIKIINSNDIISEIKNIGFDPDYLIEGAKKHSFLNIKISGVKPHISTIIKETALSNNCDAAVHKGVLLNEIETSDLILSGTKKQIEKTANSLKRQMFQLPKLAEEILCLIKEKEYNPIIMGILNITENSFSDGGKYLDPKTAIIQAKKLMDDGADIIDIGAESTAPNREEIPYNIEIQRILPIIKELKKTDIKISIDTRHHKTAQAAISEGADIINDVSGLNFDLKMIDTIKNSNAKICIMHSRGNPKNMDKLIEYQDLRNEIFSELSSKIEILEKNNVERERIITDVGFGFAKNCEQNFELLRHIQEFNSLKTKTLAGVSRKRFLASLILNKEEIDDITMLSSFYLMQNKVDIIRVHDVKKTMIAKNLYEKLYLSAK